jgi:sodium/potassium/calcium exchanger 6
VLSILIYFTSKPYQSPPWLCACPFISFLTGIIWIWLFANIVVDAIQIIGTISDIDISYLGVTFMALGNSIPDMMTDMTVAKLGFPTMGMTATVSGPVFNIMLGLGISFLRAGISGAIAKPTPFKGTGMQVALAIICALVIVTILIIVMFIRKYSNY